MEKRQPIIVFPGSAIQQTRFTGIPQSESGKKNKNRETEREWADEIRDMDDSGLEMGNLAVN